MKPCTLSKRCVARTVNGTRCKKCRKEGFELCSLHLEERLAPSRSPSRMKSRKTSVDVFYTPISGSPSRMKSRKTSSNVFYTPQERKIDIKSLALKLRQALAEREEAMALRQMSIADEQSTSSGSYSDLFSSSSPKKTSIKKLPEALSLNIRQFQGKLRHVSPKKPKSKDSTTKKTNSVTSNKKVDKDALKKAIIGFKKEQLRPVVITKKESVPDSFKKAILKKKAKSSSALTSKMESY